MALKPRQQAFDTYWRFASERQLVFERRVAGLPEPWTSDPILQKYKFCCVFRAADRVSQYMIRDVAYADSDSWAEDRLFQIVAFRTFSRTQTWRAVCDHIGHPPSITNLKDGSFTAALEYAKKQTSGLYTAAFILCANDAYGQKLKHLNHVELFRDMFVKSQLGARLLDAKSLQEVFELLRVFPLMGDFMSYQTAIDLNYSGLINFSENDFTCPGPGAVRGLRKVFEDLGDYSPGDAIRWMVDNQEKEFARLGLEFHGLWGRPLHAIDCQGLFCETDKYLRVAMPELASERKQIKAKFTAAEEPLRLFFPPKWGLNARLPSHPVLGTPLLRRQ